MDMRGVVLNINDLGALVRLADGGLATVPPAEARAHQALLEESLRLREELSFTIVRRGKRSAAFLSAQALLTNPAFEDRMNTYLRSLEDA